VTIAELRSALSASGWSLRASYEADQVPMGSERQRGGWYDATFDADGHVPAKGQPSLELLVADIAAWTKLNEGRIHRPTAIKGVPGANQT
jgi:hypothetical protein